MVLLKFKVLWDVAPYVFWCAAARMSELELEQRSF